MFAMAALRKFILLFIIQFALYADTLGSVPKEYSSYRRYPLCQPSDYFRYPTTAEEVVAIVQEAIQRNITVKAVGARHSQTDIICTGGIPIDNHGLKSFALDPVTNQVTLGAGVTLHEATEFLRNNGRAFKTTPAFGNITIAGAIGTGAHGSSIKYTSSISSQVVGVTIVDGFGNLRIISDETDLHAFRLHLGLLGIIVNVTLATEPLYKVRGHNTVFPDSILTDGTVVGWGPQVDQMSLYWFPTFGQVVVANWTIVDVNTPGNARTYDHVPSTYDYLNIAAKTGKESMALLTDSTCPAASTAGYDFMHVFEAYTFQTLLAQTPGFVPIYTEDGFNVENPAVGYYDQMFAPTCIDGPTPDGLACPYAHGNVNANITELDNEISLALSDLPKFIQTVKDIVSKTPTAFPMQGILMRLSANSETYMSTAYGRDTVHFEWYTLHREDMYTKASTSLAGYQTIMQALVLNYTGRSHWGKSGMAYHTTDMMNKQLDSTARANFIAVMNKYDPNGVFLNNFGMRLKNMATTMDLDPLTTRCALLDNCICGKDSDCASGQMCSHVAGYADYRACMTPGASPGIIPIPLPQVPSDFVNWLQITVPASVAQILNLPACLLNSIG